MRLMIAVAGTLTLAACATGSESKAEDPPVRELGGECDAAAAQHMVGTVVEAEVGAELLRLTGASTLRWVPPRTAITMDYRSDRLTVYYGDDMAIERITCG